MRNKRMSRSELAEQLNSAAARKGVERERFAVMAAEDADRFAEHMAVAQWLALDIRYCLMTAEYYSDRLDSMEEGADEELLRLLDESDLPPRAYAGYLRHLSPADRENEKVAHAAVQGMKDAMRDTLERMG